MAFNVIIFRESYDKIRPELSVMIDKFFKIFVSRYPDKANLLGEAWDDVSKMSIINTLDRVIRGFDRPVELENILKEIGANAYKIFSSDEMFHMVKICLIEVVKSCFDEEWWEEYEVHWNQAYDHFAASILRVFDSHIDSNTEVSSNDMEKIIYSMIDQQVEAIISDELIKEFEKLRQEISFIFHEKLREERKNNSKKKIAFIKEEIIAIVKKELEKAA